MSYTLINPKPFKMKKYFSYLKYIGTAILLNIEIMRHFVYLKYIEYNGDVLLKDINL